jgi:hypothetical protein
MSQYLNINEFPQANISPCTRDQCNRPRASKLRGSGYILLCEHHRQKYNNKALSYYHAKKQKKHDATTTLPQQDMQNIYHLLGQTQHVIQQRCDDIDTRLCELAAQINTIKMAMQV